MYPCCDANVKKSAKWARICCLSFQGLVNACDNHFLLDFPSPMVDERTNLIKQLRKTENLRISSATINELKQQAPSSFRFKLVFGIAPSMALNY